MSKEKYLMALKTLKNSGVKHDSLFEESGHYTRSEAIEILKQLIEDHFELIERIVPIHSRVTVSNEIECLVDNEILEKDAKHEMVANMVKFILQENIAKFEKYKFLPQDNTIYKGTIYIIRPKGDGENE